MTEFNRKYTKGAMLFVVLLLYEVPIVLHFLLFAPRSAQEIVLAGDGAKSMS